MPTVCALGLRDSCASANRIGSSLPLEHVSQFFMDAFLKFLSKLPNLKSYYFIIIIIIIIRRNSFCADHFDVDVCSETFSIVNFW